MSWLALCGGATLQQARYGACHLETVPHALPRTLIYNRDGRLAASTEGAIEYNQLLHLLDQLP